MINAVTENRVHEPLPAITEQPDVEAPKLGIADAIRLGAQTTEQVYGWGDGQETACALMAAIKTGREVWGE